MANPLLKLSALSKYYVGSQNVILGLNHIDLTLDRGEFVVITGESGSGKSTLAHVLAGILPYEDGELYYDGMPTSHYDSSNWEQYRRDRISFISQNYGILPGATVENNVVSALRLSGVPAGEALERALAILEQVELMPFRHQRAARLSSGQKQRLSIARALAKPAPILIADEPTGNLDPENSRKVIELLAEAAKNRLVILISHEFQEAESYVTRHIRIQEGRIVQNAPIRPANTPQALPEKKSVKDKRLGKYVAALQLTSRPVWSAMMLLFGTLTAFAVFVFLATFIVNLDDTFTRIYDDSAFSNGSDTRLVVVRQDDQPMSQSDYDAMLSLDHVTALERYGYAADIYCSYREGVDYELHYSLKNTGSKLDASFENSESVTVLKSKSFAKTVPLMSGDGEFLTEGRLPGNMYEVVSADVNVPLGTVLPVYLCDSQNWGHNEYIFMEVTVVGTTNIGNGLYFHDDLGRMVTHYFTCNDHYSFPIFAPYYGLITPDVTYQYVRGSNGRNTLITVDEPYPSAGELDKNGMRPICDEEFIPSATFQRAYGTQQPLGVMDRTVYDPASENMEGYFPIYPTTQVNGSTLLEYVLVSYDNFLRLTMDTPSNQVSLTISDYAYTQRVIDKLFDLGYIAISPYQLGTTTQDPELASQRMQTLSVCIGALAAVLLLQSIVLRAMFSMENESYRLLSNIGLSCRDAIQSILWQLLVFTAGGQVLGLAAVLIGGYLGISRIQNILIYLPAPYFLILSAVHLAGTALAFLWVKQTLQKQVYPQSGRRIDLELDGKEGAV